MRKHDKRIYDETRVDKPPDVLTLGDLGYLGATLEIPLKSSKKKPLTKEQKDYNTWHAKLREMIAYELEQESHAIFDGEIEVDESHEGGRHKGKRGRGAAGKIPVFGLLKQRRKGLYEDHSRCHFSDSDADY